MIAEKKLITLLFRAGRTITSTYEVHQGQVF
jgi:hypothetical protein